LAAGALAPGPPEQRLLAFLPRFEGAVMTELPHDALVLVGDGKRALFLRNTGTVLAPKLVVENVFEQENPPTREQGTDRPTRGADFTGGYAANVGSPRSNIEQTDWHQQNEDRFAKNIAQKLYALAHANHFQQLVIVAAPKWLGVLRQALHKEVLQRVAGEVTKDLTQMTIPAIQEELARSK
jgi:protein required for attachment to host cells